MKYKNMIATLVLMLSLMLVQSAQAKALYMVGSSTVAPFAEKVAKILTERGDIEAPNIEVTGTGEGIALFCSSNGENSADVTGASRRMKPEELHQCSGNGIAVSEMVFGYDAIVVTQHRGQRLKLSSKQLFLALAAQVPDAKGKSLIANPYHYWDDIDAVLPHQKITIWGPPEKTGTRDTLENLLMKRVSKTMPAYTAAYHKIREDDAYVNDHEKHQASAEAATHDDAVLAIFGYSFYIKNMDTLRAVELDNTAASEENITTMHYPLARPLYLYVKSQHINTEKDLTAYVKAMMSDEMVGKEGLLVMQGIVPLPSSMLSAYRLSQRYAPPLTEAALKEY
jgi:phosphate transport system substrate-binding protein